MKRKNIKDIVIFILIVMYFTSNILIRKIGNLDELWNYNFASNIANGLLPYKDFNMVVTPLLSIIGGVILSIFGKELIIIRILNILLNSSIIFMMYKIMQKLEIKNILSFLILIIFSSLYIKYAMFDYNFAVALVSLIIVYLEISNQENNSKIYQIIIGILSGIIITLKHTTGVFITFALLGYKLLDIRSINDFKQYLKQILLRFIGISIPILVLIIYLIVNDAFYSFIDYCILGVATFTNKVSYISRLINNSNLLIKILSIVPVCLIILLPIYIKKRDINALIIFVFGIVTLSVVFPISDETHLISGIYISIIGLAYILDKFIKKQFLIFEIFCYAFIVLFILYSFINTIYIYINMEKNTKLLHYKNIPMTQSQIDNNGKIGEYIEKSNKKVYILDSSAVYYMIPINRYNKNYDMFNLGNLGKDGEQGQIDELESRKDDIKILIKSNKYKRNWQNPEQVRQWIIQNMNKTGKIGTFDVYESNINIR